MLSVCCLCGGSGSATPRQPAAAFSPTAQLGAAAVLEHNAASSLSPGLASPTAGATAELLEAAFREAPRGHRRSAFLHKLLEPTAAATDDADATTASGAEAALQRLEDGSVCGICCAFLDTELELEIQAAVEDKQQYLQASLQFLARSAAAETAAAASTAAATNTKKHPIADSAFTAHGSGRSGEGTGHAAHECPQLSPNVPVQQRRWRWQGRQPEQQLTSTRSHLWRVRKKLTTSACVLTERLDRVLRVRNEVAADIEDVDARALKSFELARRYAAATRRLGLRNVEVLHLLGHQFRTLQEDEDERSAARQQPTLPAHAQQHRRRRNLHRHRHQQPCASLNSVNFGFVPPRCSHRHHRHRHHRPHHHAHHRDEDTATNGNTAAVRDINVSWGMVAGIVAALQRDLLLRLPAPAQNEVAPTQAARPPAGTAPPAAEGLASAQRRVRLVDFLQAGSRSRIVVWRAPPPSGPVPFGPPSRTYDLFLTPGQSRISFSFGVMAFVNLVKSMGHCYAALSPLLPLPPPLSPPHDGGQPGPGGHGRPSASGAATTAAADVDDAGNHDSGGGTEAASAVGPLPGDWRKRFGALAVRGDALGGHALSFLDVNFVHTSAATVEEEQVARHHHTGPAATAAADSAAAQLADARAAVARWNAAMDALLRHVRLMIQVAAALPVPQQQWKPQPLEQGQQQQLASQQGQQQQGQQQPPQQQQQPNAPSPAALGPTTAGRKHRPPARPMIVD